MAVAFLFTGYYRNPKLVAAVADAGPYVEILWTRALDHCAEKGTDGRIAKGMPDLILGRPAKKYVAALVTFGCWHECDNPHDGHQVNDYPEWNRSAAALEDAAKAKSQKRSAAGKKGAEVRWGGRLKPVPANSNSMTGDVANG